MKRGTGRGGRRVLLGLALLLAATGGGYVVLEERAAEARGEEQRSTGLPPDTAPVQRGDLSSGLRVEGTLGHAGERRLNAAGPGVLTWIADAGSAVARDGRLYEVNGRPVRLMYGATPMYRPLKAGDKGEDVRQLKRNLLALGHGTGLDPEDKTFTEGTVTAVKRWQKAHKAKQTGEVAKEDIAFVSGPQRVQRAEAAIGDEAAPGKPVLTLTGTDRIVRFRMDAGQADAAKPGDRVSVTLPGGGAATGRIDSVGAPPPGTDGQGGGTGSGGGSGDGDGKAKVEVVVVFDRPAEAKGPDRSPVSVLLTGETRTNVLSVPVNALLALSGGGFGVQVVENGTVREVRVELGMFGQGRVEITGGDLKDGMEVGVPKT
ncbi:peptidoglycan-binding protein [Streptomyces venezuelae]|uniref:Peptidoglycan-binding protein n=1 Tax=Streptomyces venezuelae TaxID=54571 RepID=A0A5P2D1Y1_STRVZ|nr:peptidoglycan-binding protein [Streptomyces venezuelae]QES48763.1 peptidoglycan-binding protein [Streptomyces venezuelae]